MKVLIVMIFLLLISFSSYGTLPSSLCLKTGNTQNATIGLRKVEMKCRLIGPAKVKGVERAQLQEVLRSACQRQLNSSQIDSSLKYVVGGNIKCSDSRTRCNVVIGWCQVLEGEVIGQQVQ